MRNRCLLWPTFCTFQNPIGRLNLQCIGQCECKAIALHSNVDWTPPWLEIDGFCKNASEKSNCNPLTKEPDDSHSVPQNWMSCPCWNGIKIPWNKPTATLWQKDQMTPTLTRNWIHCPWWAIRRNTIVTRRGDCPPKLNVLPLVGRYYQKLPWGTLPSNSRLILVNCFIHAGLSLIGPPTTSVSFRMCVCVLQAETY